MSNTKIVIVDTAINDFKVQVSNTSIVKRVEVNTSNGATKVVRLN